MVHVIACNFVLLIVSLVMVARECELYVGGRFNFYPVTKLVYSICEHFASLFPLFGSDSACSYKPRLGVFFFRSCSRQRY